MARPAVHVRPAVEADLPVLLAFGEELRDTLVPVIDPRARGAGGPDRRARYLEALEDPRRHLVLAVGDDDEPLGMALLTVMAVNALLDVSAVHLGHVVVPAQHRRRGAGRALVAAAVAFAEERGMDQLSVSVQTTSRDANRFFARLGFAPLAVRRTAPLAVVRRQLGSRVLGAVAEGRSGEPGGPRRPRRLVRRGRPGPELPS